MKSIWRIAGTTIAALLGTYFVWFCYHNLNLKLLGSALHSKTTIIAILFASACHALVYPITGFAWRRLLLRQGCDQDATALTILLGLAQLAKYIPGNVAQHIYRTAYALKKGIPIKAFASTVVQETFLAAAASILIGTAFLAPATWQSNVSHYKGFLVFSLALSCIGIFLFCVKATDNTKIRRNTLLGKLLHVTGGSPGPSTTTTALCAYACNYLLIGLGIWLLASTLGLSETITYTTATSAFAIAWILGFLAPGAPAGLGAREGIMLLVLSGHGSNDQLLQLVVLARFSSLLGDMITFSISFAASLFYNRPPPRSDMKANQLPTGERVIEDAYQHSIGAYTIYAMHAASYAFVEEICKGKSILDLGCGSGYGTRRISNICSSALGVDISQEAIGYASEKYQKDNLRFQKIDANQPLPFIDNAFDVVLSFQVIEHIQKDSEYLREASRVLVPGGILVVITPDRANRLLPGQKPWNRWHVREYDIDSLYELVNRQIPVIKKLKMGAPWEIAKTEINRYQLTKLICLPVTLPFMPEKIRVNALNLIHKFISKHPRRPASHKKDKYNFDETAMIISEDAENSLNLIIIAQKNNEDGNI